MTPEQLKVALGKLATQEERNALLRKVSDEAFAKAADAEANLAKALETYRKVP